jgi:hypothetical protein
MQSSLEWAIYYVILTVKISVGLWLEVWNIYRQNIAKNGSLILLRFIKSLNFCRMQRHQYIQTKLLLEDINNYMIISYVTDCILSFFRLRSYWNTIILIVIRLLYSPLIIWFISYFSYERSDKLECTHLNNDTVAMTSLIIAFMSYVAW